MRFMERMNSEKMEGREGIEVVMAAEEEWRCVGGEKWRVEKLDGVGWISLVVRLPQAERAARSMLLGAEGLGVGG